MFFDLHFPCFFMLFMGIANPFASAQTNAYSKTIPPLSPSNTPTGGYASSLLTNTAGKIELSTIFVDWAKDDVFLMTVDSEQVPRSCIVSGSVLNFEDSDRGPVPIAFSFKILDTVVAPFYRAKKGRPEEITDYSLPLARVIEGNAKARSRLDHSLMLELIACDAGGFIITNRMPAERRFFGYPVRSCLAFQKHGARQWYTNINGAGIRYARVQHPDKAFDPDQENAKTFTKESCRQLFLDNQFKPWADTYSEFVYRVVASSNETSAKALSADKAHERENL